MPLHDPAELDRERIEYWKKRSRDGTILTAYAVAVIDDQSPAGDAVDKSYPYEEQFLLSLCMLDGHHRVQAAAELGQPVRIFTLLTEQYSRIDDIDDISSVVDGYRIKSA